MHGMYKNKYRLTSRDMLNLRSINNSKGCFGILQVVHHNIPTMIKGKRAHVHACAQEYLILISCTCLSDIEYSNV